MDTYNQSLAQLVEDFINTHDLYLEQPEHLLEPADLEAFLKAQGITSNQHITRSVLEQVRLLRDELRACWTVETQHEMVERLNPLLGQAAVFVQMEGDTLRYEVQQEATLIQQLATLCGIGIATILQNHGIERMRACASSPCRDVFVDISRNKSRRFCSERCANRYNIAVFRERQKDADG